MPDGAEPTRVSILRLVLYPALITLAVTLLRLGGELAHLKKAFFNPEPGGPWAVVGITWLAPIFGIYFAVKLARAGAGPASLARAIGVAVLGVVIILGSNAIGGRVLNAYGFKAFLIFFWTAWALAGLLQCLSWPELFKVQLAYGFAARVPVALVMFFAFWSRWGTHYDALPSGWQSGGLWTDFLWLGFFPQMLLWVGYTVVAGMFFGSVVAPFAKKKIAASQETV